MEEKKYFISTALRRRFGYLKGTLNNSQIFTNHNVGGENFNVITLKDYKNKEHLLKSLNLKDLDVVYNSQDIKISVIMPTYNQANFISNAINDILSQTHKNLELIIVNDGSTDNTEEIVKKFEDPRIKYFSKTNGGTGSALNLGIFNMSFDSKYSTWVSSDNRYYPNFLEKLCDVLEFNIDCQYAFSAFDWKNIHTGQSFIMNGQSENLPYGKYNKSLIKKSYDMGLCFLYRTDLLNKFFYEHRQAEDYVFVANCGKYCDFYNVKDVLGCYQDHEKTLSRTKPEETFKTDVIAREIANKY